MWGQGGQGSVGRPRLLAKRMLACMRHGMSRLWGWCSNCSAAAPAPPCSAARCLSRQTACGPPGPAPAAALRPYNMLHARVQGLEARGFTRQRRNATGKTPRHVTARLGHAGRAAAATLAPSLRGSPPQRLAASAAIIGALLWAAATAHAAMAHAAMTHAAVVRESCRHCRQYYLPS